MNTITTQDANLLWNIYWNVFGNTNETVNFFKTIRLDWETSRFKTRVYKDKEYIDVDLWPILTWQILYSSIYYNYYDNNEQKVLLETNKFNYWEPIVVYNHNSDSVIEYTKESFNEYKATLTTKLKFNRVLYIKLLDWEFAWEVFELFVKLSQSHWIDKDKKYNLKDPLSDWLGSLMNQYKDKVPFNILKVKVSSYTCRPITVTYPSFSVIDSTEVNSNEVIEIINKVKLINLYKYSKVNHLTDEKSNWYVEVNVEDVPF